MDCQLPQQAVWTCQYLA